MKDSEKRRLNLIKLIRDHGSQKALVNAVNNGLKENETQISETQISGAINQRRNFGDKICRKIEAALGKPLNWFEDRANNFNASPEQQGLNQYWSMMTKEDQRSLLSLAARLAGSSKDSEGPVPLGDTGPSEKENA